MKKIPLRNSQKEIEAYALVDDEDFRLLGGFKWYKTAPKGYAGRTITIGGVKSTIHLHRAILWCPAGHVIDHVNRNTLDNRRKNLRIATRSQNLLNSKIPTTNSSGTKGVYWSHHQTKPWRAQIQWKGKTIRLGYFKTIEEASEARKAEALRISQGFGK